MAINKLAIIGGSGLYDVEEFKERELLDINTPWGKPSDQILKTKYTVAYCKRILLFNKYITWENAASPTPILPGDRGITLTICTTKLDIKFCK